MIFYCRNICLNVRGYVQPIKNKKRERGHPTQQGNVCWVSIPWHSHWREMKLVPMNIDYRLLPFFTSNLFLGNHRPTGGKVVREAGCYTKGPGFKSRVRHGCRAVRPWLHQWLSSKTSRREVPGSFLGSACRPNRSEFSVVFTETGVNTG